MIPFRSFLQWTAECSRCKTMILFGGFTVIPGSQIPLPTLPDGWLNLGDMGVICPQHRVKLIDKKARRR